MEDLKAKRWTTGKAAVQTLKDVAFAQGKCVVVSTRGGATCLLQCNSASSGSEWHIRLARYRNKHGPGDWHVTDGNLDHQNCVSVGKPSTAQLVTSSIVRGALSAEPTTSARNLVDQLRHQANMNASYHVMYRAKDTINEGLFAKKVQRRLLFYQVYCRNFSV